MLKIYYIFINCYFMCNKLKKQRFKPFQQYAVVAGVPFGGDSIWCQILGGNKDQMKKYIKINNAFKCNLYQCLNTVIPISNVDKETLNDEECLKKFILSAILEDNNVGSNEYMYMNELDDIYFNINYNSILGVLTYV